MITHRKAKERRHGRRRKQEIWHSFNTKNGTDPLAKGFGALEVLNEDRVPPGETLPRHTHHEAEMVTYVREGSLTYEDSMGNSGVIHAGEFQRMTVGRGVRPCETNASRTDWAHVFQVWLSPPLPEIEPSHEQKRFSAADRRGALCVVASPDAREGSLGIHPDALVFSAILSPGQHVVHEIAPGRRAWLHLVQGEATLGDVVLTTGDGAGFTDERAVSLTAQAETELLLFDLGPAPATA